MTEEIDKTLYKIYLIHGLNVHVKFSDYFTANSPAVPAIYLHWYNYINAKYIEATDSFWVFDKSIKIKKEFLEYYENTYT